MREYITAKLSANACKLVPVYVIKTEEEEAMLLENKTIKELQVLIFQRLESFSSEMQMLQEEIYQKNSQKQK